MHVDLDGSIRSEAELVTKYRQMSGQPEIEAAVIEIVNEAVCIEDNNEVVKLNLDNLDEFGINEKVKQVIIQEFKDGLRLLEFNTQGYNIFKRFYIDARINYHCIVETKHPEKGIQELRYVDPRKIRKIREIAKNKPKSSGGVGGGEVATIQKTVNEYYIYNDKGFGNSRPGSQAFAYNGQTQGI